MISRREIRTYFNSPVAYIVVPVFVIVTGYLFFTQLFLEKQADMRGFFNIMPLLFMFMIPAITMRLLADERSSGTLELLITMPVRDWEVVVGKFLAAMALLCTAIGPDAGLRHHRQVARAARPRSRPSAATSASLLMGAAYVAIGVMASSLTRNSIVSFIVAFAICFALYLLGKLTQFLPAVLAEAAWPTSASIGHFENIGRGVVDTRDLLYYFSVIGVSLLVATPRPRLAAVEVAMANEEQSTPSSKPGATPEMNQRKRLSASERHQLRAAGDRRGGGGEPDRDAAFRPPRPDREPHLHAVERVEGDRPRSCPTT